MSAPNGNYQGAAGPDRACGRPELHKTYEARKPPTLSPGGPIVRAADLAVWAGAEAALAAARDYADWLERVTRITCQQAGRDAWNEGYRDGAGAVARLLAKTEAGTARHFEQLKRTLPDLVADILNDLVGEREATIMIERSVRRAIAEHPSRERLVLKVAPDELRALSERLADLTGEGGERWFFVEPDDGLDPGVAFLWSRHASIELSVPEQLQRLREALGSIADDMTDGAAGGTPADVPA